MALLDTPFGVLQSVARRGHGRTMAGHEAGFAAGIRWAARVASWGFLGCVLVHCGGSDGGGSSSGTGGAGGGAPDSGSSPCDVAWSCSARSAGTLVNCIEQSSAPSDQHREACEGQSVGEVEYAYAEASCDRAGAAVGCLVEEGSECSIAWIYGGGSTDFIKEQCADQGHEPVDP